MPSSSDLRVVVVQRPDDLLPYREAWADLARAAVEPNVFFEPELLLPSLRLFLDPADMAVVLVLADAPGPARTPPRGSPPAPSPPPQLVGLFPLERRRRGPAGAFSYLRLWTGEYSYLPSPLLRRERAAAALAAFFDWLEGQRLARPVLAVDRLPLGLPFHTLLVDELGRRPHGATFVRERYTRALFEPRPEVLAAADPAQTYLAGALPAKDRREIQRQKRRLGESGRTEFLSLGPGEDATAWAEAFLAIEASGWKGRNQSAFANDARSAAFFRQIFAPAHAAGRLYATQLRLHGKPLAIQILLHAGGGAYGFKTCYDEAYARHAPGLLLEVDLIERALPAGRPPWRWIDPAANRHHPLFNRLYTERRVIEDWYLTTHPALSLALASAAGGGRLKALVKSELITPVRSRLSPSLAIPKDPLPASEETEK